MTIGFIAFFQQVVTVVPAVVAATTPQLTVVMGATQQTQAAPQTPGSSMVPKLVVTPEMVENLPCTECGLICPTESALLEHLKTHKRPTPGEGSMPLKCPYCTREFWDKHKYSTHVRFHTGETPFKCPVCNKGFRDSRKLKVRDSSCIRIQMLMKIREFDGTSESLPNIKSTIPPPFGQEFEVVFTVYSESETIKHGFFAFFNTQTQANFSHNSRKFFTLKLKDGAMFVKYGTSKGNVNMTIMCPKLFLKKFDKCHSDL